MRVDPAAERPEVEELRRAIDTAEKRVEAIQAIASAVGSTLDLSDVLGVILERITELLDAKRSTLFLLNDSRDQLVSMIAQGTPNEIEIRLKVGEGIAGWVARTGRTLNIKDAYEDPRFAPGWDRSLGFRTESILCVPMRNLQRRILGVVQVLNKRGGYFTVVDEHMLSAVAGQAAVTIENAKLYAAAVTRNVELLEAQAKLEQKVHELDTLYEVEQEITRAGDVDGLLESILGKVTEVLDAEAASLLLPAPGRRSDDRLSFRAAVGPVADKVRQLRVAPGEGIIGWAAQHGGPVRVDDVAEDDRHSQRIAEELGFAVRSEVAAPLVDGDYAMGAISVLNKKGHGSFTDDDLKLLTLVAGQVGRALVERQARQEAEKQDRLAAIGRMLSGVVHDLKTPMTIISGYVQLMSRKDDPDERARYSDLVRDQFANMDAMTREVLAFARGDSELLVRKVHLNDFVGDLEETLRRQVEDKSIELAVHADRKIVAWFDETKMLRAVHNLCRNAIEAMPDGGKLAVSFDEVGDELVIRVADTGGGIPNEIRDVLFDSFVTTGKDHGSGLGLAIVKRIVEDHGGSITFRSRAGRGTTFVVRIPQSR